MYKNVEAWIDNLTLNSVPENVLAFCFNLYDGCDNAHWSMELVGADSFDAEDSDWACPQNELYTTGEELFGFTAEDWEAALDLMLETMSEAIAEGILPDTIEYVAAGFVDGDLEEVFYRA